MQASDRRARQAMPLVRRILDIVGQHYPDGRWEIECPADEDLVMLYLFVDASSSWDVDRLARPVSGDAAADGPTIVIVVQPRMVADLPGVHSAPICSSAEILEPRTR